MKITSQVKIGRADYTMEFDERDDLEALHQAAVLSNPIRKCNVCGNVVPERFKLDSNKDKEGNIYINVVCGGKNEDTGEFCGAKSKLGQYKAGGYFWHKFEKWEGK